MEKKQLSELRNLCLDNEIDITIIKKNDKGTRKKTKKELIKSLNEKNIKCETDINTLVPLFKWCGGKKDEIKYFKHHFPKNYDTYLEPFFGGAAVLLYLQPKKSAISDVHEELITFYKQVKNKKMDEIYTFMDKNKNDENTYYKIRNMDRNTEKKMSDLDIACRFFYLRKTCFRGMLRYNKKGHFNIPYGRYKTYNFDILKNKQYEDLFQNVNIHLEDFEYIFKNYDNENNFMFLDPPYDTPFSDYGYCSFGREKHKRLAELFKKSKCKCLMIISETEFIKELYKDYIVETFDKKYKFRIHSNRINTDNIDKKHLIIKNY
jgi:DNA adenine methylase